MSPDDERIAQHEYTIYGFTAQESATMTNTEKVRAIAQHLRNEIATWASLIKVSPCDLEAEILAQSLMSNDCDKCHVNWLDLHDKLEFKLSKLSTFW